MSVSNGSHFSNKHFDQDTHYTSCSHLFKGGWWYANCHHANPNGLYLRGNHRSFADGINWYSFRGHHHSLKTIEMKLRKK